jgi:hypothetical protein
MKRNGDLLAAFLAGALAGAVIGILYAPDKGSETIRKIVKGNAEKSTKNGPDKKQDDFEIPYMPTMSHILNVLAGKGYKENFMVREGKLTWINCNKSFSPDQVKIDNFYRFEGESDPDDMSILYAIQTITGVRGTLVDAYGTYSDPEVSEFIKQVQLDHKAKAAGHKHLS